MYAIVWKGAVNPPRNYEFLQHWNFAVSLLRGVGGHGHLWKKVSKDIIYLWFISKCFQ